MCWKRARKVQRAFMIALPLVTGLFVNTFQLFLLLFKTENGKNCAACDGNKCFSGLNPPWVRCTILMNIIYRNVKSHKIFLFMTFQCASCMYQHAIFKTCWQTLRYKQFSGREISLKAETHFSFIAEDDLGIASLTSSHIQTTSPQPAYGLNSQTSNFVASHMLGQSYATENSNFGPIYHHHNTHHHAGLPYSYEKYKMPASPSANVYQHYQGFYGHQIRQVEYIPRWNME